MLEDRDLKLDLLALGLLVNQVAIALAIITVLSLITAGQRLLYAQRKART